MNTVFLHAASAFRSSVPKMYTTSNFVRRIEKENNVKMDDKRRKEKEGEVRDFSLLKLNARNGKNGNCEIEN